MAVASFPVCDLPKVTGKLHVLCAALSRALAGGDDVPRGLVRGKELDELWRNESLVASQRCGYDLVNYYAGILLPLVTLHYTAPRC